MSGSECAYSGMDFTACKESICDCFAETADQQGTPDEVILDPSRFVVDPPPE